MIKDETRMVLARTALATGALLLSLPASAAQPPAFITSEVEVTAFDGVTDDLLTAGLGAAGIAGAAPTIADPDNPTAAELRRLAIYNNYRALVDVTAGGGFGTLYGPGVDGLELIAGVEYLAYSGDENITLLVQIPDSFDPAEPCIVTGTSSGSRGVYGAIGTSGEWGLNEGCAVAYSDKGTGTGAHDLSKGLVRVIDGVETPVAEAGEDSNFTAPVSTNVLNRFDQASPNRFAFKHAHSQDNPEANWGLYTIQAVQFALWALSEQLEGEFTSDNTIVNGSSVSNGGGSAILAAEQAPDLFDGVAVSEPNINPVQDAVFAILAEGEPPLIEHSRSLYDYTTFLNLYQGCANFGFTYDLEPLASLIAAIQPLAENVCTSLAEAGLLDGDTTAERAAEAQALINGFGFLPEQNLVQPAQWLFSVPQAVSVTYANAYAMASVIQSLCGYSFAATAPGVPFQPVPLADAAGEILFSTGNGIPPTGGVNLVNDASLGGAARNDVSVSPAFGRADQNLQGALCLRFLATGDQSLLLAPLTGAQGLQDEVEEGIEEILATGKLEGTPTLIVHGRSDGIIPPNHASRPYYWISAVREQQSSTIRYYEIVNAQHLDAFNGFPDFALRYVPLHHYFLQALDLLYAHLTARGSLPPSQVVTPTPREQLTDTVTLANLPPIASAPAQEDRITVNARALVVPE